ncbi:MAG TPA: methyltransferase domain-containing protein [Nitrososphaeraceae archaeon]
MKEDIIKQKVKERYGKIALVGSSSEGCCAPSECCGSSSSSNDDNQMVMSPLQIAENIGYNVNDLNSIPESSILGVGCGAPVKFADIQEGEIVVDIGSGGGIDVFLSANKVKHTGKVIGIDMTDEMLEKAADHAKHSGYTNVEFKKGDIERGIPINDNAADVVISNCVINLTIDKIAAFKEIYRILKNNGGGRMVISDLVTSKEVDPESANSEKWCSCIDGALTKEHYLESIRKAGFSDVEVLEERLYMDGDNSEGRRITSLVIKAVKS